MTESNVENIAIGDRFGRLVVIDEAYHHEGEYDAAWHCECDCGGTVIVSGGILRRGLLTQCACDC